MAVQKKVDVVTVGAGWTAVEAAGGAAGWAGATTGAAATAGEAVTGACGAAGAAFGCCASKGAAGANIASDSTAAQIVRNNVVFILRPSSGSDCDRCRSI